MAQTRIPSPSALTFFQKEWRPDLAIHAMWPIEFRDMAVALLVLTLNKPTGPKHLHFFMIPPELLCMFLEYSAAQYCKRVYTDLKTQVSDLGNFALMQRASSIGHRLDDAILQGPGAVRNLLTTPVCAHNEFTNTLYVGTVLQIALLSGACIPDDPIFIKILNAFTSVGDERTVLILLLEQLNEIQSLAMDTRPCDFSQLVAAIDSNQHDDIERARQQFRVSLAPTALVTARCAVSQHMLAAFSEFNKHCNRWCVDQCLTFLTVTVGYLQSISPPGEVLTWLKRIVSQELPAEVDAPLDCMIDHYQERDYGLCTVLLFTPPVGVEENAADLDEHAKLLRRVEYTRAFLERFCYYREDSLKVYISNLSRTLELHGIIERREEARRQLMATVPAVGEGPRVMRPGDPGYAAIHQAVAMMLANAMQEEVPVQTEETRYRCPWPCRPL